MEHVLNSGGSHQPPIRHLEMTRAEDEIPLTAIMEIEGAGCDVALYQQKIQWSPLNPKSKGNIVNHCRPDAFKRKKKKDKRKQLQNGDEQEEDNTGCSFLTKDILSVILKTQHKAGQSENDAVCQGFVLTVCDTKENGRLKPRLQERPKNAMFIVHPFSGKKFSRHYYYKLLHYFDAANIEHDLIEIAHDEHIKHTITHMDFSKYDSIVCIGGDGTVSKVVNEVLMRVQKDEGVEVRPGFEPRHAPLTIGVIPTGTFNQIAYTMYGNDDIYHATASIILGRKRAVDVFSVYHQDDLKQFGFLGHYGFFGNLIPYMKRYTNLGEKRVEAGFMKALTKSKFRSYECEVKYLPLSDEQCPEGNDPKGGRLCRVGCKTCDTGAKQVITNETTLDLVHAIDQDDSDDSSIIVDDSNHSPYRSIRGSFHSISVLSNAGNQDLSPGGMSKYAHLNDGCLDLIMVKQTDRKEFVRYLKRHGNCKNQLDFPFVEAVRAKDVVVNLRSDLTWKHRDISYNEIEDEMRKKSPKKIAGDGVEVINDLDSTSESDQDENEAIMEKPELSRAKNRDDSERNQWANTNLAFKNSIDEGQIEMKIAITEFPRKSCDHLWRQFERIRGRDFFKKRQTPDLHTKSNSILDY
ncbi:hypothetical protein CAPTEDRAFT_190502 [Capitella teleta]|uniref:DAGKc domain-containing protein n=1 Tax=Capitella teleta TaxID=283909 RepID=R7TPL1_CAPTE|nr:hypothetical protein CAPTEDRAFT_190502 [Capitella teleta]|eukprot:ELT92985.1 hypothetical protein CAPTEDRAFT_190502 [Capitella teleta]